MKGTTGGQGNGKQEPGSGKDWVLQNHYTTWKDMGAIAWQFPLFGFLCLFTLTSILIKDSGYSSSAS